MSFSGLLSATLLSSFCALAKRSEIVALPTRHPTASRRGNHLTTSTGAVDPVRRRQLGQLARAKGPVERRLMRMRQTRRGLFRGGGAVEGSGGESKGGEGGAGPFEGGDESLALIQW